MSDSADSAPKERPTSLGEQFAASLTPEEVKEILTKYNLPNEFPTELLYEYLLEVEGTKLGWRSSEGMDATSTGPNVTLCQTLGSHDPKPFTFKWTIKSFSVYMCSTRHIISPVFEDPKGNLWRITVVPSNLEAVKEDDDGDETQANSWHLGIFLRLIETKQLEKYHEISRANLTIQMLGTGGEVLLSETTDASFKEPKSDSISDWGFNYFVSWATLMQFYSTYVPQDILRVSIRVKPFPRADQLDCQGGFGHLASVEALDKKFQLTISEYLKNASEKNLDMILLANDGTEISTSLVLLSMLGTKFRKILDYVPKKSSPSMITLFCGYDPDTIKSMIEFACTGKLQQFDPCKPPLQLLKLAKEYGIDEIVQRIQPELELRGLNLPNVSETTPDDKVKSEESKHFKTLIQKMVEQIKAFGISKSPSE